MDYKEINNRHRAERKRGKERMAFCSFDDSAALFDSTPVENMFITEYMLRAPGDFVKVYLYPFFNGEGLGYAGGRR